MEENKKFTKGAEMPPGLAELLLNRKYEPIIIDTKDYQGPTIDESLMLEFIANGESMSLRSNVSLAMQAFPQFEKVWNGVLDSDISGVPMSKVIENNKSKFHPLILPMMEFLEQRSSFYPIQMGADALQREVIGKHQGIDDSVITGDRYLTLVSFGFSHEEARDFLGDQYATIAPLPLVDELHQKIKNQQPMRYRFPQEECNLKNLMNQAIEKDGAPKRAIFYKVMGALLWKGDHIRQAVETIQENVGSLVDIPEETIIAANTESLRGDIKNYSKSPFEQAYWIQGSETGLLESGLERLGQAIELKQKYS